MCSRSADGSGSPAISSRSALSRRTVVVASPMSRTNSESDASASTAAVARQYSLGPSIRMKRTMVVSATGYETKIGRYAFDDHCRSCVAKRRGALVTGKGDALGCYCFSVISLERSDRTWGLSDSDGYAYIDVTYFGGFGGYLRGVIYSGNIAYWHDARVGQG